MRKQSIINRRYLDKLAETNPEKLAEIKYKRRRSSAKSFIIRHLKKGDLTDFSGYIKERKEILKGGR